MKDIQQAVRWLAAATIGLYLAIAVIAFVGYLDSQRRQAEIREVAETTQVALCTLRADLAVRVAASKAFLAEHPDGIAGISAATLEQSIRNQEATIAALRVLHCAPSPGG